MQKVKPMSDSDIQKHSPIVKTFKLFAYGFLSIFHLFARASSTIGDFGSSGRSDYNIGSPEPTLRPENYRTMKRRNRLMRKFDHPTKDSAPKE